MSAQIQTGVTEAKVSGAKPRLEKLVEVLSIFNLDECAALGVVIRDIKQSKACRLDDRTIASACGYPVSTVKRAIDMAVKERYLSVVNVKDKGKDLRILNINEKSEDGLVLRSCLKTFKVGRSYSISGSVRALEALGLFSLDVVDNDSGVSQDEDALQLVTGRVQALPPPPAWAEDEDYPEPVIPDFSRKVVIKGALQVAEVLEADFRQHGCSVRTLKNVAELCGFSHDSSVQRVIQYAVERGILETRPLDREGKSVPGRPGKVVLPRPGWFAYVKELRLEGAQ